MKNNLLLLICLSLFCLVMSIDIDCKVPANSIQQQYCNTQQLIALYNRKLKILQQLNNQTQIKYKPIALPQIQNQSIHYSNTLFKGESIFVPPDKIINENNVLGLDGKLISKIKISNIIAVVQDQVTSQANNITRITKLKTRSRATESKTFGIFIQGANGLYLGKSPTILFQYYQNNLLLSTKSASVMNISFNSNILTVFKGYNNEAIYVTNDEYGMVSATKGVFNNQSLMYETILNATSDGVAFLYLLTIEGKLIIKDIKTNKQIGLTQLFQQNNIKSQLFICYGKLYIHRQSEPYLRVYNVSNKNNILNTQNFTICKDKNNTIYRYQTHCTANSLFLLCGVGVGNQSQWKFASYIFKNSSSSFMQVPKYFYALIALFIFFIFYISKSRKKGSQMMIKQKKMNRKQIQQYDEQQQQMLQKLVGPSVPISQGRKENKKNI